MKYIPPLISKQSFRQIQRQKVFPFANQFHDECEQTINQSH